MLISASSDVLRLPADPLRARIVESLAPGAACTCDLVADTGARQPKVSGHLRTLREAGLVAAAPRGPFTFYRLLPEAFERTAGQLADLAQRAHANADTGRECP